MMETMKYKIGDKVFKASTDYSTAQISCPDCLGTKEWVVTFADGKSMVVGCQTCKVGFGTASGYVTYKEWRPSVIQLTIGKIYDWNESDGFRYICEETGIGSGQIHKESDLFFNKNDAQIKSLSMHEEQMKMIARNNFSKKLQGKEQIENMLSFFGFSRREKIEKTRKFIQWAKISGLIKEEQK